MAYAKVTTVAYSSSVAARLPHKGSEACPGTPLAFHVLPAKRNILRVGDAGFEPATSAV